MANDLKKIDPDASSAAVETTVEAQLPGVPLSRYYSLRNCVIDNTRVVLARKGYAVDGLDYGEIIDLSIRHADSQKPVVATDEMALEYLNNFIFKGKPLSERDLSLVSPAALAGAKSLARVGGFEGQRKLEAGSNGRTIEQGKRGESHD
jgi:hypothetical protein